MYLLISSKKTHIFFIPSSFNKVFSTGEKGKHLRKLEVRNTYSNVFAIDIKN